MNSSSAVESVLPVRPVHWGLPESLPDFSDAPGGLLTDAELAAAVVGVGIEDPRNAGAVVEVLEFCFRADVVPAGTYPRTIHRYFRQCPPTRRWPLAVVTTLRSLAAGRPIRSRDREKLAADDAKQFPPAQFETALAITNGSHNPTKK